MKMLSDTAFATSAFGEHTVLGTISVITGIMAGVAKPFLAKLADLFSRPWALALSVFFYTIGYIVVAASKNVGDVAGGEVIYTIGNTGLDFITSILLVGRFPAPVISYFAKCLIRPTSPPCNGVAWLSASTLCHLSLSPSL